MSGLKKGLSRGPGGVINNPENAGRLFSASVEAAKALPDSINRDSVKNKLLQAGARPIELEYSNLDEFLKSDSGKIASEDVIRHLQTKGPMGEVFRLDSSGTDVPSMDEDRMYRGRLTEEEAEAINAANHEQYESLPPEVKKTVKPPFRVKKGDQAFGSDRKIPATPENPFGVGVSGGRNVYPTTAYSNHTEAGVIDPNDIGDEYREVLFFDPKARVQKSRFDDPFYDLLPVDPHDATAWVRYSNNPESLDVTNIQSDLGQEYSRSVGGAKRRQAALAKNKQYEGVADRLEEQDRTMARELWPNATPGDLYALRQIITMQSDSTGLGVTYVPPGGHLKEVYDQLLGLGRPSDSALKQYINLVNSANVARLMSHKHYPGARRSQAFLPDRISPLIAKDNWRQLPLRHLLLESAQAGGKPISFPIGSNVTAVEGMPRWAAEKMYRKDVPESLIRILRPMGGGQRQFFPGQGYRIGEIKHPIAGMDGRLRSIAISGDSPSMRAGTFVTPSQEAVQQIMKYGLPYLSVMPAIMARRQGSEGDASE